jgi:hypothetical protein
MRLVTDLSCRLALDSTPHRTDWFGGPYNYLHMEISHVRRQLKTAIDQARARSQQRRQRAADAERAYAIFLETIATPVTRQVANALKAEGYAFTVFTPGGGLRLAWDRSRDDYLEFALDDAGDRPQIVARTSRTRGSRTIADERPLKKGTAIEAITEADVLEFLLELLEPWLER